ncbi:MAG: DUF2203 domain-containing protein [Polyangiaceae bacterium]|jgi:hypothetical protein
MIRPAMIEPPAVFTLEEVNALVPRLNAHIGAQMSRRTDIEQRLARLSERIGGVPEAIRLEDTDPPDVHAMKEELLGRVEEYQTAWRQLEELGAVLKDARLGLLDFYGRVDGTLVWLCWKFGEDAVTHYHALDEGFAGRKPIQPMMRNRHLN